MHPIDALKLSACLTVLQVQFRFSLAHFVVRSGDPRLKRLGPRTNQTRTMGINLEAGEYRVFFGRNQVSPQESVDGTPVGYPYTRGP